MSFVRQKFVTCFDQHGMIETDNFGQKDIEQT